MKAKLLLAVSVVSALAGFGLTGCSDSTGAEKPGVTPPTTGPLPGNVPFGTIPGLVSMVIFPPEHTLRLAGTQPTSLDYVVEGTFDDGHVEDVTTRVRLHLADAALGSFVGSTLTSHSIRGGRTAVRASAGDLRAETTLTLILTPTVQDAGSTRLPADVATRFAGTETASRAPSFVYPSSGVWLPPNLGKLELHFLPGTGNDVFELRFESALSDVRVHLQCTEPTNGGCIYTPSFDVWRWVAESNRGGSPVTVTVKGTDAASSAQVGTSAPLTLHFSADDLRGGIYYWTTSGSPAIMRYDFARLDTNEPEVFVTSDIANGQCIGCHALSRDGSKMVVQVGGSNADGGSLALVDVKSRTNSVAFPAGGQSVRSFFMSWNPDGSQFTGVWNRHDAAAPDAVFGLRLFDGNTAQWQRDIPATGTRARPANHPDWSADGEAIAYQRVGRIHRDNSLQWPMEGSIELIRRQANGWSAPTTLVPQVAGRNHYYPAISPDSSYLVFNESRCDAVGSTGEECNADADPTAVLQALQMGVPGAKPVLMSLANAGGVRDGAEKNLMNSFPKWSPFNFRGDEFGSRLHWMTFSSTRKFGLRDHPGDTATTRSLYLWMAAVEPGKLADGKDPSAPAFFLPFQDLKTSNHIAQWTERAGEILR